jgi:hypothetical protein
MELQDGEGGLQKPFGNIHRTIFASGVRDETHNSQDFDNLSHRGVQLVLDITAETAGGSTHTIVVTIQGKDPTSGKYYTLLQGASKTATGTTLMTVHPGVTASANVAAAFALPRTWRVLVTHTADGASDMTYSIGADLIP